MAAKPITLRPEPTYLECGFGELEYKVINQDICCKCGTCEAFCPRVEQRDNRPTLVEYDPLCGLCYAYCPRTFLDMPELESRLFGRARSSEEVLGIYRRAVSARASQLPEKAQDGGAATALLVHALERGIIDCAVVTDRDEEWRPVPRVATTPAEIVAAAGTKYTVSSSVTGVQKALDMGCQRIGFVGTPCQVQALRKIKLSPEPYEVGQERIALLVGLFCMENFEHGPLMDGLVRGVFGLEPHDVERFEIKKGMFRAISKGKAYEVPIKETDRFAMKGCAPCFDFVAELADVSVGSVGSPGGWSTVLTRTDLGHELYSSALAAGALEERPIQEKGLALANRLAGDKARRFQERSEGMKDFGVKR